MSRAIRNQIFNLAEGIGSRGGASWSPVDNVSLLWDQRVANVLEEPVKTLAGQILLPAAEFNGTNNYLISNRAITGGQPVEIDFKFLLSDIATVNRTIFSAGGYSSTAKGMILQISAAEKLMLYISSGSVLKTISFQDLQSASWGTDITGKITWNGQSGGEVKCELWGTGMVIVGEATPVDYSVMTSTDTVAWDGDSSQNVMIGAHNSITPSNFYSSSLYYLKWANNFEVYLNGLGLYEYDVLGEHTFTWAGSVGYSEFRDGGSDYHLTNGWRKYVKDALVEYVPVGADTTVIEAAGYSLAAYGTYTGYADEINMFPCLVDMNPTIDADADLAILDRSDVTYQTAVSRDAADYDASNPFRYRIETLADPRVHSSFFNVGYAGTFYAKIRTQLISGVYYIKSVEEMFLTSEDKTGADQVEVLKYCGSNVLAL